MTRPSRLALAVVAAVLVASLGLAAAPTPPAGATAAAIDTSVECAHHELAANDDGSSESVALPFPVNFFGVVYDSLYVNNNGNVTFEQPQSEYTPYELTASTPPIIAPFFADVDTEGEGSALTTWGVTESAATYGGADVFCVRWDGVGYYSSHTDLLNDFQLLLVEVPARPGDFIIYFNYESIAWETGDASGGTGGFGGTSAGAGYSGGVGSVDSYFELACSRVNGACLDTSPTGLAVTSTNSSVPGRHVFAIDNGGQTFPGSLAGTVTATGDPAVAVADAWVQACPVSGGRCRTTLTGDEGSYEIRNLVPGPYSVAVRPPSPWAASQRPVDIGQLPVQEDFVLTGPTPPPPGVTVDDDTPVGQIPVVVVGTPLLLHVPGCGVAGTGSYTITSSWGQTASGTLDYVAATDSFEASFAAPFVGEATIEVSVPACPEFDFTIYIDPAGHVRNMVGDPVAGATVTLYRADSEVGPLEVVPDGDAVMAPSNRANPDTTDDEGYFGWDVVPGFYSVRAEADGCASPLDTTNPAVGTPMLDIPPPVTDLDLRLWCGEQVFSDVGVTNLFFFDVLWLFASDITSGYPDGTFRLGSPVDRGSMAAFVYRAAGSPEFTPPAVSPFSDVPTSHVFYGPITWMADQGITTGYTDGTFQPNRRVGRGEMAAFLLRFAESLQPIEWVPPATTPFSDVPTTHIFYAPITWMANAGITTGYLDGSFGVSRDVGRGEMAAFLHRFHEATTER